MSLINKERREKREKEINKEREGSRTGKNVMHAL